jgi:TonB family protein
MMKKILLLLCFVPLFGAAQVLKVSEAEKDGDLLLETTPVNLKAAIGARMDASLSGDADALILTLSGTGAGTGTVDKGNEAVFLLENKQKITVRSVAVQGFENRGFVNTYKHAYSITPEDLEVLSRHNVQLIKKVMLTESHEIEPDAKNAANLKNLSLLFLRELEKRQLLVAKPKSSAPAFPGGKETFLQFIKRNIKAGKPTDQPASLRAVVQFTVGTDGSVNGIKLIESAGGTYDNELLRVLKRMPRWKPAMESGNAVETTVTQPVVFHSQKEGVLVNF